MGVEEKMLIEEYGDEYLEYMKATSKLFPYIY
jgi:protein-S-isoprenylcysteine O-methyltransferase Ste14